MTHEADLERASRFVIRDVAILDGTGRDPVGRSDVEVGPDGIRKIARSGSIRTRARSIDGSGCTLMPGLTDAHVHLAVLGPHGDFDDEAPIAHVLNVARMIDGVLDEGFTTVRDAGGLEPTWAKLVASGTIRGPRILPSGSVLSQTGGHGDVRAQHEAVHRHSAIPGLIARSEVVDGPDEVRRAAREQLRRGATQIKVLASGGVVSPTDPFDSIQFSPAELEAAVEVAANWNTYVMAHCHTSPAIRVAIEAGVRSIEHGSLLDRETAREMQARGVFLVPTLQAISFISRYPERFSLSAAKIARVAEVATQVADSLRIADEAGIEIGSGSDVVGPWQGRRGEELVLKAKILGAHKAIVAATRTNARLFGLEDRIGTVEVGKVADLILVAGEPLDRIELLAEPTSIPWVMHDGIVVKDADARTASID